MSRLVQVSDAFIHPIDRDRVLDQVIRADAKEVQRRPRARPLRLRTQRHAGRLLRPE